MSEQVQVAEKKKPTFAMYMESASYQKHINATIKDPQRARQFVAAICSAVSVNPALQECTPLSILTGALLGESLNLTPSPQLGQYYLVPFKKKKNGKVESVTAQFVLGYKGYLQLAIRSGNYKKINVLAVKEGELTRFDPLEEEIEVNLIEDEEARERAETIGYYAMFEYLNGFRKAMYWSKSKMLNHADRYSPAFSKSAYKLLLEGKIPNEELYKYSSFWYKDFDDMAQKTMLRQLISKWGIMSVEMQRAFEADEGIVTADGKTTEPLTPNMIEGEFEHVDDEQGQQKEEAKEQPKSNEPEKDAVKSKGKGRGKATKQVSLDEIG